MSKMYTESHLLCEASFLPSGTEKNLLPHEFICSELLGENPISLYILCFETWVKKLDTIPEPWTETQEYFKIRFMLLNPCTQFSPHSWTDSSLTWGPCLLGFPVSQHKPGHSCPVGSRARLWRSECNGNPEICTPPTNTFRAPQKYWRMFRKSNTPAICGL